MRWSQFKLVGWFLLWILIWLVSVPFKKKGQVNCFTWAIDKWDNDGGYLVIRWCRSSKLSWFKWPHFLWLPEDKHQELLHVVPANQTRLSTKYVPDPWFTPEVLKSDDPNSVPIEN